MNLALKLAPLINKELVNIPSPLSLSYVWGFGSLLGIFLLIQIISGVFLSFFYSPSISEAFSSVVYLSEEIPLGWVIRSAHSNGASFFFVLLFLHIGRGLYFNSFNNNFTWFSGVGILFVSIATAFLGYVLPWGQMSYWGATVITNLLSAFPLGENLVVWVWGGFSVSGPTLSRFFSIHFLLPFVIIVMVVAHLVLLHENGSQNPLGIGLNSDKAFFHPLYTINDLVGLLITLLLYMFVVIENPDLFIDPDNFTQANGLVTPAHIQPEWYFLFAYAILRSIPSNLGGVVALALSVIMLLALPLLVNDNNSGGGSLMGNTVFWSFCGVFFLLSWVGSMPVEGILVNFGQILSVLYFSLLTLYSIL